MVVWIMHAILIVTFRRLDQSISFFFQLVANCCGTGTGMSWMRIGLTVRISFSVWKAGWPLRPIGRLTQQYF